MCITPHLLEKAHGQNGVGRRFVGQAAVVRDVLVFNADVVEVLEKRKVNKMLGARKMTQ